MQHANHTRKRVSRIINNELIKAIGFLLFGFVWLTRQALLESPKGRNASRDGLVKFKILGFGIVFATFAIVL